MLELHDINQFPQSEGLLLFGISMSRIGNAQSAESCLDFVRHLAGKIEKTEGVGAVFLYADYLYLHSDEPASKLRNRYKELMIAHKNAFLRLLFKDDRAWIRKAFSFYTFGQMMLDNAEIFGPTLSEVERMYENDLRFRETVHRDRVRVGREEDPSGSIFILEEITLFYLTAKGKLNFNNRFVSGTEQWVLQCYPGKPLESEIYLFQKNPLNLTNSSNRYEDHFYDLEARILYKYADINLESFPF